MKRRLFDFGKMSALVLILIIPIGSFGAGMLGVFQGKIVRGPVAKGKARWLYVQSRNGMVRRVNIARASVEYDEDYPVSLKQQKPASSLALDVEVRITAEQEHSKKGDGEWQGREILIIAPRSEKPKSSKT